MEWSSWLESLAIPDGVPVEVDTSGGQRVVRITIPGIGPIEIAIPGDVQAPGEVPAAPPSMPQGDKQNNGLILAALVAALVIFWRR